MKKLIALLLCIATVMGLCACAGSGENSGSTGLQVGYARENITPDEPVPLAGYGKTEDRISTGFLDYLYATCIAFREGDQTVLWFTQDIIKCNPSWVKAVRDSIQTKTGVPGDHIMICSTHTHSAPDTYSNLPAIANYKTEYVAALTKAAETALADLAPAKLYGTHAEADLNFVRHYELEDGTYLGDNFGNSKGIIKAHAAENDPDAVVLKVEREGEDKKPLLIMNWQAHPCKTGGSANTVMSADLIGGTRDAVEAQSDYLFAYFTGAAGNQNTSSRIAGEEKKMDKNEFGKEMAGIILASLENAQPIEGSGIQTSQIIYEGAVNHDDEHLSVEAQQVVDTWNNVSKDAATTLAHSLGLSSVYHASAVLSRPSRPQTTTTEINAVRIGGFAFITAGYEMFAAHGKYIKENSPFDITFVCSCSNEADSYIPTVEAYDYGCYESYVSVFAKGEGEKIAEKHVENLKGLQ